MSEFDLLGRALADAVNRHGDTSVSFDDVVRVFNQFGMSAIEARQAINRLYNEVLGHDKAKVSYTARAARLNARPRKSKRHGERRGL